MDISAILSSRRTEIIYDLPWDDYCELPGLSPSTIVKGLKSVKHLKHCWDNKSKDSDTLLLGRAIHSMLFEPQTFTERYTVWETRRAGNAYKAFLKDANESGKDVLSSYMWYAAQQASKSFIGCRDVQDLIRCGKPEVSLLCVENGMQMRGRCDWIDQVALVDLKTTKDISYRSFSRDFYKYHYDTKLGLYQRWLEKITGEKKPVKVVVLEKELPFDVAVLPIDDAVLERGVRKGLDVIEKVKVAIGQDCWPGAGSETYFLDTPTWEMDDELEGVGEYEDGSV